MADPILVPATLPPTPLVLADSTFLGELAKVENAASAIVVANPDSAQEAANLLRQLTAVGGSLEKTRADLKKPYLDLGRKIDEVARLVSLRIERSKTLLRTRLTAWNDAEIARLAAERRKRDEELMALRRKQEEEAEAEAKRVAALAAATPAPAADSIDFDFDAPAPAPKTETQRKIEAIQFAPAPVAAKPAGVRFARVLKYTLQDVNKLPEQFVVRSANDQLIRTTYCAGWKEGMPLPQVPGLMFWDEATAVSTGRATP